MFLLCRTHTLLQKQSQFSYPGVILTVKCSCSIKCHINHENSFRARPVVN